MDELDFLIDDEYEAEEWFCDDCNMGPIAAEKTKCPRCGFKLKYHHDEHQEMDDEGNPIDMEEYHKHY